VTAWLAAAVIMLALVAAWSITGMIAELISIARDVFRKGRT
jgi:hypothetical protein